MVEIIGVRSTVIGSKTKARAESVPQTEVKVESQKETTKKVNSEPQNVSKNAIKNMQRVIKFNKFRNIGLDEPQELVLNCDFKKGRMGNLLVLIGSNNSGKSNVLDGILKLNDKIMEDRDVTDLSYDDEDMNPSISLGYKNDEHDIEYIIDLENSGNWKINKTSIGELPNTPKIDIPKDVVISECGKITKFFKDIDSDCCYIDDKGVTVKRIVRDYYRDSYENYHYNLIGYNLTWSEHQAIADLKILVKEISADEKYHFARYKIQLFTIIKKIHENLDCNKEPDRVGSDSNSLKLLDELNNSEKDQILDRSINIWTDCIAKQDLKIVSAYFDDKNNNSEREFTDTFSMILGASAIPNVYRYQENFVTGRDLYITDIAAISKSKFFRALFNSFENFNVNNIINAYNKFDKTQNDAILNKLKKEVGPKLNKINDRFNKLYFASNDGYKFTLNFSASRISFGMARGEGEDAITLEYQSRGFRWFFNLFFNFLANNSLKAGDIVIMDEPATNLHPQGQAELRKIIKEFAVKNDIMFIIATHSPFLIDPDNYDELRVVSMENNRSTIENKFTAVNYGDPDSLLPIKESLTIKQNVLYDLDTEVVWVEGITDYIYLTMFKNILNLENIAFLPFNGVGKNEDNEKDLNDKRELILKKIKDIKFSRKSMLVDADTAGMGMYDYANSKETDLDAIHNLSEIDIAGKKKAKVIEDLFSSEDREKYKDIIKDKRGIIRDNMSLAASELKIHAKKEDFSEETIANFTKLFELFQDN